MDPAPVQMHLYGLPTDLIVSIISDFVAARETSAERVDNYEQWLRMAYGDTFAEAFPMVYGRKYHTTTMDHLTTDWLGPRMYRPSLDELLRGALGQSDAETHYVTSFDTRRAAGSSRISSRSSNASTRASAAA